MDEIPFYDVVTDILHESQIPGMSFVEGMCNIDKVTAIKLCTFVGCFVSSIVAFLFGGRGNAFEDMFLGCMTFDPGNFN